MTGMPLRTALPESGSSTEASVRTFTLTPGVTGRDRLPRSRQAVTPAVRDADDARHHDVGQLDRDLDRAGRRADGGGAPSARPSRSRVGRVELRDAAVLPAHEHGHVLRPRVGRPQLAAPDEHHAAGGGGVESALEPGEVGDQRRRRELDLAGFRRQCIGKPRPSGPKSIPCGWCSSTSSESPSGRGAEARRRGGRCEA